jgi:hypothetical protein
MQVIYPSKTSTVFTFSKHLVPCLMMAALVTATACDRDPMVRVYEVEVRKPNPTTAKAPAVAEPKRMLGAIVPAGKTAIFLKLTGKPDVVDTFAPAVKAIAESVKVGSDDQVDVELPQGWVKGPPAKMAQFTIAPPSMDGVDEAMTVTVLPGKDDADEWKAYVDSNLARWQAQLGIDRPASLDELLKDSVQPMTYTQSNLPAYFVNLVGKSSGKPSMPPFASGAGAMSPLPSTAAHSGAAPTGDSASQGSSTNSIAESLKYDLPEGWVSAEGSQMRLATFRTASDENAAEISIVPASGEEKQIVQLWAGSVYGDETVSDDMVKSVIDQASNLSAKSGQSGKVYKIVPPADDSAERALIVAVFQMPEAGAQQLFVKMQGPSKSVAENESKFNSFIQSLTWQ